MTKLKNIIASDDKPLRCCRPITIGIDIDDVLQYCMAYAIKWLEKNNGIKGLSIEECKQFGSNKGDYAKVVDLFALPDFVGSQPMIYGARDFIKKLLSIPGVTVYFITAVPTEVKSVREQALREMFPEVPAKNIILTSSKNVAHFDIFIDDAPHNIFANLSDFRLVKRQPWNANITGMASFETFDQAYELIKMRLEYLGVKTEDVAVPSPAVYALVGPTGAHKNDIAKLLVNAGMARPTGYTTRTVDSDEESFYTHIDEQEFISRRDNGEFFVTTMYGRRRFALPEGEVRTLLEDGKNVVIPVDLCGYATLKSKFPTVGIYVDRRKEELLSVIVERDYSLEEKTNRIMSLETEQENRSLCDYMLPPSDSVEQAAQRVINLAN